jgi:hypothetical protein
MTPTHAKLQAQTLSTLNAPVDMEKLCLTVKSSARETFYHTVAAIETVDHPFDYGVGNSFVSIPKANLITLQHPPPVHRSQVFGCYPIAIPNVVDKTA